MKEFLAIHRHTNALPHNSYIVELLGIVLTNNYFDFNGKHFHQISGTAMGTKLATSYANLFMTKFEQNHVYTYHLQPTLWKRFIDDIFMIWPHGKNSLLEFIKHLNTVHPTIKFTSTISQTEIAFLDLIIYIRGNKLYTRLHTKNTETYVSELPLRTPYEPKKVYTILLNFSDSREYTLSHITFYRHKSNCIGTLDGGEYPHGTSIDAWNTTNQVTRETLLSGTKINQDTNAPLMFITTYNSANPKFKELISKHWSYLGRSSATRE